MVAFGARLAGMPGVYVHDCASSFCRFGAQDRTELSPARIVDTSVEPALGGHVGPGTFQGPLGRSGHVLDREVLDAGYVAVGDQPPCHVVVQVPTLVGHRAVAGGNGVSCCSAVVRATLRSGQRLLGGFQSARTGRSVAGIGDVLTVGGGEEAGDPNIGPHRLSGRCQGNSERRPGEVWPFSAVTTSAGPSAGQTRTNRCTWSGITSSATISHPRSSVISTRSPANRSVTRPPRNMHLRYVGRQTTCRPGELTPPAERRKRVALMTGPTNRSGASVPRKVGATSRPPMPLTAEVASSLGAL